ncbi:hypothetical protein KUTeg_012121 [Tegillarca granosa]|uniref:Tripartite motif-containing protein 45 n=1 Tax=Tegillarca granosa TaxID=220873 RepID=A0ABQ9F224_TEGGR|nr:hypothetical protein KUTeg_012121 [Tegillarca granosa]
MLPAKELSKEFLICSECREEFDQENNIPRILFCLHTFCEKCLNQLVVRNSIVCPSCKTKSDLSPGGVQCLPEDVSRRNMVEFAKVKERTSEILCRDCPDDNQASGFCRDCHIYMCIECTDTHRRSVASKSHTVLSIGEIKHFGADFFQRKLKCTTPGHEGQPLEFFCSKPKCKIPICTKCIVPDHDESKGHVVQNLVEYHAGKLLKLQECLKVMDESIKVSNMSVQHFKQELVNMDISEYETEKEIDKCFSDCFKALESRRLEMKEQFSSICQTKKKGLQSHVSKVEHFLEDIINAREFLQNLLKHTDPTEFVNLYRTFSNRQKSLSNEDIDLNRDFKMPTFDPLNMGDEYLGIVSKLGTIDKAEAVSGVERCRKDSHHSAEADDHCKNQRNKATRNVVLPALSPRKIQLAKSLTQLGSALRMSNKDTNDKMFRSPVFNFDQQSVHQYRKVINGTILTNDIGGKKSHAAETNLKNFRGVVGNRSFKYPGKFYFEVIVNYTLIGELDSTNMVFEIGICRQNEIDTGYCVYNHQHGWSFSLQHCQDHHSLCQWSRHNGQCFSHVQLSSVDTHSEVKLHYGFLLDTENSKWTIINCITQKCLYKFKGIDCTKPLWPVFGCHWPSKVVVKMNLITGHEIALLPSCIRS